MYRKHIKKLEAINSLNFHHIYLLFLLFASFVHQLSHTHTPFHYKYFPLISKLCLYVNAIVTICCVWKRTKKYGNLFYFFFTQYRPTNNKFNFTTREKCERRAVFYLSNEKWSKGGKSIFLIQDIISGSKMRIYANEEFSFWLLEKLFIIPLNEWDHGVESQIVKCPK